MTKTYADKDKTVFGADKKSILHIPSILPHAALRIIQLRDLAYSLRAAVHACLLYNALSRTKLRYCKVVCKQFLFVFV